MLRGRTGLVGTIARSGDPARRLAWVVALLLGLMVPGALRAAAQDAPARVRVSSFQVDGNTLLPQAEVQKALDPFQGKEMTLQGLKGVADALTLLYQKKGFMTVRVLVPQQTVGTDGVVKLHVVQNKMGRFKVSGNKHYSTPFLRWYFEDALKDEYPQREKFERAVLLLNEFSGLKASTVLEPGETPDTVDVTLAVEDRNPLRFSVDYNNYGSHFNGYNRPGAGVRWGNLTGNGDELIMHGFQTLASKGSLVGTFGYGIPVSDEGTRLTAFYSNAAFGVGQELEALDIRGKANVFGLMVLHPFIRRPGCNVDFQGGFVFQDIHNSLLGVQTSRDYLRELVVGATTDWTDQNGRWYAGLHMIQDFGPLVWGMNAGDVQSSRGVGGGFNKWTADLARVQRLSSRSMLILRGSSQAGFSALPTAEQYALGGVDSVRGYRQASYLGDGGYNLSAEFRLSPLEDPDLFQVTAFVDYGHAYLVHPAPGEISPLDAAGAGIGFRVTPWKATTLNFDLGFPLGTNALTRAQGHGPVPYIYFTHEF